MIVFDSVKFSLLLRLCYWPNYEPVTIILTHIQSDHANVENVKLLLSFAYGVAGDVFMILFEKWEDIYVKFHEGFNNEESEVHEIIAKAVEDIVDESMREWTLKVFRSFILQRKV